MLLLGRSLGSEKMDRIQREIRADPVVEEVYRAKSEELGPGTFRFVAEIEFSGTKARSVTTLVPIRPRSRGERRSLRTLPARISPPTPRFQSPPSTPFNSASDAFELHPDIIASRGTAPLRWSRGISTRATARSASSCTGCSGRRRRERSPWIWTRSLKMYGEEVVTAVGDEVDRIEKAIVRVEPSIHYVDLETN